WLDLENPTHEEVRELMDKYSIDPLIAEELLSPTLRPKVDLHTNFIYLILHFPSLRQGTKYKNKIQEIDFIVGKNVLITTRYDAIDPVHSFSKIFEVNSILNKNEIGANAGHVFFYMIRGLYRSLSYELEYIKDMLRGVENKIFSGKEREMVMEISKINRTLLSFKEATDIHKEVLESFERSSVKFFGEKFEYYARSILGEYYKVRSSIQSSKEYLDELNNTNNSLLTTNQNEIMKKLTIVAFLTLPFSVMTGFFQMGTTSTPIMGTQYDWWIIMGIMTCVTILLLIFAKTRKWF
ncbi:CorA family divalent cation transporter, partial [Candidatus Nomurabacteria bacterium]|nr:CorA family divalent cation transporter [Candidatus Nomurabacteria bacterium]